MNQIQFKKRVPESQSLNKVGLNDLAERRLAPSLNKALDDGLEIVFGIKFKDEHVALKANRDGLKVSSRIRWRGLGMIIITITSYVGYLINKL